MVTNFFQPGPNGPTYPTDYLRHIRSVMEMLLQNKQPTGNSWGGGTSAYSGSGGGAGPNRVADYGSQPNFVTPWGMPQYSENDMVSKLIKLLGAH